MRQGVQRSRKRKGEKRKGTDDLYNQIIHNVNINSRQYKTLYSSQQSLNKQGTDWAIGRNDKAVYLKH